MKSSLQTTGRLQEAGYISVSLTHLTNALALPPLTTKEITLIRVIIVQERVKTSHSSLFNFLVTPHVKTTPPNLVEFHDFFKWLLLKVVRELNRLRNLHNERPKKLQTNEMENLLNLVELMRYFAWESNFFKEYIQAVSRSSEEDKAVPNDTASNVLSEARTRGSGGRGKDVDFTDEGEEDFPTEHETGEGQTFKATANPQPPPSLHEWILDLRLLTSNTHHLRSLFSWCRSKFSFSFIQYSISDKHLKSWYGVIQGLFKKDSDPLTAERAIVALRENCKEGFRNIFQPGGPPLQFHGQPHCEAVLACLYSIAQKQVNTGFDWVNIEQAVLSEIKPSYNLLAPSKRCCPYALPSSLTSPWVLVGHNSMLSVATLSSFHAHFPTGLPCRVREKLFKKYKGILIDRLTLVGHSRARSSDSRQNDTLSSNNGSEMVEMEISASDIAALIKTIGNLPAKQLVREWETMRMQMEKKELAKLWARIPRDKKLGLTPPEEGIIC